MFFDPIQTTLNFLSLVPSSLFLSIFNRGKFSLLFGSRSFIFFKKSIVIRYPQLALLFPLSSPPPLSPSRRYAYLSLPFPIIHSLAIHFFFSSSPSFPHIYYSLFSIFPLSPQRSTPSHHYLHHF